MKLRIIVYGILAVLIGFAVADHRNVQSKIPVVIKLNYPDGLGGYGTGFMVQHRGEKYIITASHVCDKNLMLLTNAGQVLKVLHAPPFPTDVCVLEPHKDLVMQTSSLSPAESKYGDKVYSVGFNEGNAHFPSKNHGRVLINKTFVEISLPVETVPEQPITEEMDPFEALMMFLSGIGEVRKVQVMPVILAEITLRPGNSGGPLFNRAGQVIGVASITNETNRLGWYMKSSAVIKILEEKPWQK